MLFSDLCDQWPAVGAGLSQILFHPRGTKRNRGKAGEEGSLPLAELADRRRSGLHWDLTTSILCVAFGVKVSVIAKRASPRHASPPSTRGTEKGASSAEWERHVVTAPACILLPARHPHDVVSDEGTLAVSVDVDVDPVAVAAARGWGGVGASVCDGAVCVCVCLCVCVCVCVCVCM